MTNTLEELERAVKALTDMRDAARDGTPVTDPNEWEFDELTRILAVFHFLLSDRDELLATVERLRGALEPLKNIADAYDDNSLDDEARKYWGRNREHYNERPADQIELYTGRGGSRLLTLADCLTARAALTIGEEK